MTGSPHSPGTPRTGDPGAGDPGAGDPGAGDPGAGGPDRLADLDRRILTLVTERTRLSRTLRAGRVAAGHRRVEHAQENQVVARYAETLGPAGSRLALILLELARDGAVTDPCSEA